MKRNYIKLNDNYSHLSLGNIINSIKDESKNKTSAIQSEVFCAIFNIEYINESTVNNYCIGSRGIGNDYKQIYINLKKKYANNKDTFLDIMDNILSIVEGSIYDIKNINLINANLALKNICHKLYNISKNDAYIPLDILHQFKNLLDNKDYYSLFIQMLMYAILDSKQPLYEDDKIKNTVETLLENTDISITHLQDFLILELNEGISFSHSLINLAKNGNPYACYHLAIMEYRGEFSNTPNYLQAYKYFKIAEEHNHPSSCWMIGNMLIQNKIGNKNYKEAVKYFEKAKKLGSIAGINSLGLCYQNGWGVKKNMKMALAYFEEASQKNYVYALNNLGKYYENKQDFIKAKEYFLKSANLNESYACNKIGEYLRKEGKLKEAFDYYNKALESTLKETTPWAYYNLAKYYYLNGNLDALVLKNQKQAIAYFEKSQSLISSLIELLYIYYEKKDKDKVIYYKKQIENHPHFTLEDKEMIELNLKDIKEKMEINLP